MATADCVRSILTTFFPGADVTGIVGEDGRESVTLARTTEWCTDDKEDYVVAAEMLKRHGRDGSLSWSERVAALTGSDAGWTDTSDGCVIRTGAGDVRFIVRRGFEAIAGIAEYWVPTEYVVVQPNKRVATFGAPGDAVCEAARAWTRNAA